MGIYIYMSITFLLLRKRRHDRIPTVRSMGMILACAYMIFLGWLNTCVRCDHGARRARLGSALGD